MSSQRIVDLEAHIDSLRSTIALLDTTHITTTTAAASSSLSPEAIKVIAMESNLAELRDKFQQQYESLTNIISDMSEERNRLLLQTLDLQMKCDFQQTELQERLAQMEEMRRLQLTIATTSSSTRAMSASSSASSSIMAIGEEDGNKEVGRRLMEEKAALQSQVLVLKSREVLFKEEKSALLMQISVMKAMRMRKLKVTSQRMAAVARLGQEETANNFYHNQSIVAAKS